VQFFLLLPADGMRNLGVDENILSRHLEISLRYGAALAVSLPQVEKQRVGDGVEFGWARLSSGGF
jgi:hypothetical protein